MASPYFSFVIPCHNEEGYIGRLLKDISAQEFLVKNYETIVIDNSSSDQTVEEIWRFAESNPSANIKLIHEYNLGVSIARNSGGKKSIGNFLIFLDADNRISDNFLSYIYARINKNSNVMAGTFRTLPYSFSPKGFVTFWILELIKLIIRRPFGKSFVKKSIFDLVGGFNIQIKLGENGEFLCRVKKVLGALDGKFIHITNPVKCSLRRFNRVGYIKILIPWFIAYAGINTLPYKTMTQIDSH